MRALPSLLIHSAWARAAADEPGLLALPGTVAQGVWPCVPLAVPGGEAVANQGKQSGLQHRCLGSSQAWRLPLSDSICFPGACRNALVVWGQQMKEIQQLRDEVARLMAEVTAMSQVMLPHLSRRAGTSRAPHKAFPGPLAGLYPLSPNPRPLPEAPARASPPQSPFSWPGLTLLFIGVFPRTDTLGTFKRLSLQL